MDKHQAQAAPAGDGEGFSIGEAYRQVKHLMQPDARIYWADFLASAVIGWSAFALALFSPVASPWFWAGAVVATFAFYRAAIFIHELSHFRRGFWPGFRIAWNLLIGIPLLVPSFTYDGVHTEHHVPDLYGTRKDGEYVAFACHRPLLIIGYVLFSLLIPAFFLIRFLLLAPLSWLIPPLRPLVWRHASSLSIDLNYERADDAIWSDVNWRWQEVGAFLWAAFVVGGIWLGFIPLKALLLWYGVAVAVYTLNALRTLAAHAYRYGGAEPLSRMEQFLDSVDVPGHPLITPLWAPVGLRFHATHHLFPSMPYHNLPKAWRILSARYGDAYLAASRRSLPHALLCLWRDARAGNCRRKEMRLNASA